MIGNDSKKTFKSESRKFHLAEAIKTSRNTTSRRQFTNRIKSLDCQFGEKRRKFQGLLLLGVLKTIKTPCSSVFIFDKVYSRFYSPGWNITSNFRSSVSVGGGGDVEFIYIDIERTFGYQRLSFQEQRAAYPDSPWRGKRNRTPGRLHSEQPIDRSRVSGWWWGNFSALNIPLDSPKFR